MQKRITIIISFFYYIFTINFKACKYKVIKKYYLNNPDYVSFTISSQFYNDSYNNLKNFKSIQANYHLKTISEELKGSVDKDTKVLSTNHILILYYLDVPNFSYMIHPALYDYPEITNILKENKKVQNNEIINLLQNNPYVLEGNFNFDDLNNNYTRLNTNNINLDFLEYWKIDRSLNVFCFKIIVILKLFFVIIFTWALSSVRQSASLTRKKSRFKSCSAHKGFSEIFTYIYPKDT